MRYINEETLEILSHRELCIATNASIPRGQEYGPWKVIQETEPPAPIDGFIVQQDGVEARDGGFYSKWVQVEAPKDGIMVPQSISRFKAMAALHQAGLLEAVENYMAEPTTPFLQKLAWKEAQSFERNSPTVAALAGLLNLTDSQLDQMFIDADKIIA